MQKFYNSIMGNIISKLVIGVLILKIIKFLADNYKFDLFISGYWAGFITLALWIGLSKYFKNKVL